MSMKRFFYILLLATLFVACNNVNHNENVLFDYDDRSFFGISYDECGNYSDVLDTKGNYYMRSWDCQEDNTDK